MLRQDTHTKYLPGRMTLPKIRRADINQKERQSDKYFPPFANEKMFSTAACKNGLTLCSGDSFSTLRAAPQMISFQNSSWQPFWTLFNSTPRANKHGLPNLRKIGLENKKQNVALVFFVCALIINVYKYRGEWRVQTSVFHQWNISMHSARTLFLGPGTELLILLAVIQTRENYRARLMLPSTASNQPEK